jgi:hypothetical protein
MERWTPRPGVYLMTNKYLQGHLLGSRQALALILLQGAPLLLTACGDPGADDSNQNIT